MPQFVYLLICWWTFGYSNSASMNMHVHVFVWVAAFISCRSIPKSGITGSFGNSMFNLLRNGQIIFHSRWTSLFFYHWCTRVPNSSHLCHTCYFPIKKIAILVGMKWCLIVVLISIFLMTNDIEQLFMCLLFICISSLEKCLFNLPIFKLFGHFVLEL